MVVYLWSQVVNRHHGDVETYAGDRASLLIGDRKYHLDVLSVWADVQGGRHVRYFQKVDCMLETENAISD